jgi:asparagine synthetase B (glutamine-hydrolysing)
MIYLEEEFREPVKYELSKKGYDEASERYVNDLIHIIGDNRKFKDKLPVLMLSGGVDSMMLGCILKEHFGLKDSITVGCVQDTKDIEVSEDTASQLGINQKQVFVTLEEILDTMRSCMYTDDHFLRGKNITTTFDLVYYLIFKLCLQKVNVEIENTDLVQGDGADTLLGSISVFMYKDVPVVIRKFPHLEIDKDRAKTIIKQKFYRDKIDPNNTKHKGSGQLFVELSEELGANAIMAFKHPDILRWVNDLEYKFSRPDIKLFPKKVIEYLGYDPIKVDRTIMEQGTGIYDIMKIVLELMASSSQSGKSPNSAVKELVNTKLKPKSVELPI